MTNGEKIQTILDIDKDCTEVYGENGTMTFTVTQDFWNAEYKEPTIKNNLEVDCISRQFMYELGATCIATRNENGKLIALGTIEELPSVTPQEPKRGHWIVQPSNKEQGERDFIWWKCSECGQVIFSETEHDRLEFHAFCGRCGADMRGEEV